ncbi:hypothetical protein [Paenibacillus polymyxa]|uniref:hypothetical protein n=1 Tax=Paenibacillus polymyxa TaxID=1406 RepID=UPI00111AEE82|nr:hypothetical protein [Paenibacillus polymyxa]QDA30239.1 hypothetical protein FGY93_25315 [Paenibacillus polymyxa]
MSKKLKKDPPSPRGIGDVTSITIPKQYRDVLTDRLMPVSEPILLDINLAIQKRGLVHLVMTGIYITHQLKEINDYTEFYKKIQYEIIHADSSQMIH